MKKRDRYDLRGKATESWVCVDCGINTAPGHPTRVEWEQHIKTSLAIENLSGKALPLHLRYDEHCEVYIVRDAVWKAAEAVGMSG